MVRKHLKAPVIRPDLRVPVASEILSPPLPHLTEYILWTIVGIILIVTKSALLGTNADLMEFTEAHVQVGLAG